MTTKKNGQYVSHTVPKNIMKEERKGKKGGNTMNE